MNLSGWKKRFGLIQGHVTGDGNGTGNTFSAHLFAQLRCPQVLRINIAGSSMAEARREPMEFELLFGSAVRSALQENEDCENARTIFQALTLVKPFCQILCTVSAYQAGIGPYAKGWLRLDPPLSFFKCPNSCIHL
jgi:hypothetical protein